MSRTASIVLLTALSTALLAAAPPEVRWLPPVQVAEGEARVGPWRMNRSDWAYVDDPAVALADDGATGVVWVDQSRKNVFFQRFSAEGEALLPRPVNVSRSDDVFSWLPRVVPGDGDPAAVYVLWQEIVFSGGSHGGDILFARSTDGGRSFQAPVNLSRDQAGSGKGRLTVERWHNGSLDLARGGAGRLYAAWTDYEGSLWFTRSADAGRTFAEPHQIVAAGGPAAPARGPSFGLHGDNTVHLAWSIGEAPAADVHLVRSTDGGRTFTRPRVAVRTPGHSDAPKLVVSGDGVLHLFYAESPGGRSHDYHVAHARLHDWNGTFSEPVDLSRSQSRGEASASFPSVAAGADDRLYVLWELFPSADRAPTGLGYTVSVDNGRSFAAPAAVPGSLDPEQGINGSLQGRLMQKLAAHPDGRVAVVNSTFRPARSSTVRLIPGRH